MASGILLVTHVGVAHALMDAARHVLGRLPPELDSVEIAADADPEQALREAAAHAASLDHGEGVLVLSDLYGATPCNIATRLGDAERALVSLAEEVGAIPNLWQASPESVAAQAARSEVTWAGMARRDTGGVADASAIAAQSRPLVEAGASWLVFGWPVDLPELAAAARLIRSG